MRSMRQIEPKMRLWHEHPLGYNSRVIRDLDDAPDWARNWFEG
jgi:hypothetical protein